MLCRCIRSWQAIWAVNLVTKRYHSSILVENTVSNASNRLRLPEEKYCTEMSSPLSVQPVLSELAQKTTREFGNAHMMVSEVQARLLHTLVGLLKIQNVLEIGTFTGYSALAMASALRSTGSLISLEANPECHAVAKQYVEKANLQHKVDLRLGKAIESLESLVREKRQFDLIFLDANKKGYIPYFNLILDNNLLADDGVLIADNILFFGQVHRAAGHEDHQTPDASKNIMKTAKICHEFNEHVRKDPRVTVLMLPIFDGISVIRKKHAVE